MLQELKASERLDMIFVYYLENHRQHCPLVGKRAWLPVELRMRDREVRGEAGAIECIRAPDRRYGTPWRPMQVTS
jgi:hypothetical protein